MKIYYIYALGNECSKCKNILCSTKSFTTGLIYKVKTKEDLEKLSHKFKFWKSQNSNLSNSL